MSKTADHPLSAGMSGIGFHSGWADDAPRMKRRARRRGRNRLAGLFLIPAVILTLPVTIPVAMILRLVEHRRMVRRAASFVCPTCGKCVGRSGARLATDAASRFADELRRQNPDVKFTLARAVHAICPHCQARYHFSPATETFELQAPDRSAYYVCSGFVSGSE